MYIKLNCGGVWWGRGLFQVKRCSQTTVYYCCPGRYHFQLEHGWWVGSGRWWWKLLANCITVFHNLFIVLYKCKLSLELMNIICLLSTFRFQSNWMSVDVNNELLGARHSFGWSSCGNNEWIFLRSKTHKRYLVGDYSKKGNLIYLCWCGRQQLKQKF